jgi:NAD(P)-dependent dehydrogenase (short-subunit alcohol dehydrogenase family)
MDISTAAALVTGANRGLGAQIARQLVSRGARVYAGARNPSTVTLDGVTPLAVDTTDAATIAAAVQAAGNVTLLVNNAGIERGVDLLSGDLDDARAELETNYFGTLEMIRAFAPVIESNGGGAILNVLSVLSWVSTPDSAGYCASKSAEWSMTNAVRAQLLGRGIVVSGLHVGLMATEMAAGFDGPKTDPAEIAAQAIDGIAAGAYEILADDLSRGVQAGLAGGVAALYPDLA